MAPRGSNSSKKHGHSASGRSKGQSHAGTATTLSLSFIFTVNEIFYDQPDVDVYYQNVPPTEPSRYTIEIPSVAMRYQDGIVTVANGYEWYRDSSQGHSAGYLAGPDSAGVWEYPTKYKTFAVFACNPLLPILVCPDDPFSTNTTSNWQLLQIFHPRDPQLLGISQVAVEDSPMSSGGQPVRYAAGSDPSWIPSLLPATYKSPLDSPPRSRGLGGELGIIIGLMALSAEQSDNNNNIHATFLGRGNRPGKWRYNRWNHDGRPRGYPKTAQDDPRGFLVTIFLDPANPEGSTPLSLGQFEWYQVAVTESGS